LLRPPDPGPGAGALSQSDPDRPDHPHPLFDVERFRSLPHRYAVAHRVEQPTLVLGSTQGTEVVDAARAAERGVAVVRRRGGGGAVLLRPGDHLWVEAWVPRHDPLWEADVATAAAWVGAWWNDALGAAVASGADAAGDTGDAGDAGNADEAGDASAGEDRLVHRGRAEPGPYGALICFSGRGPGELFSAGRKVMGISQWRSREGALFHTCAYAHWDPQPLIDLLDVDMPRREALQRDLPGTATGILDLGATTPILGEILLTTFPTWEKDSPLRHV
jgi:lipoate-protein ligase A